MDPVGSVLVGGNIPCPRLRREPWPGRRSALLLARQRGAVAAAYPAHGRFAAATARCRGILYRAGELGLRPIQFDDAGDEMGVVECHIER